MQENSINSNVEHLGLYIFKLWIECLFPNAQRQIFHVYSERE